MLCGNFRGIRSQHLLDSIWKWAAHPVVILSLVSLTTVYSSFCFGSLVLLCWHKLPIVPTPAFSSGASLFLHGQCHVATITPFVCLFRLFHFLSFLQPVTDEYQCLLSYKRALNVQCWMFYANYISLYTPIYFPYPSTLARVNLLNYSGSFITFIRVTDPL